MFPKFEIRVSKNKEFPYLIVDENGGNVALFVYEDEALKFLELINGGRG
jgi:hypothetical protein